LLNNEKVFRTYIQNYSKGQDINGKATAIFMEKILDNNIHNFLSKTFTNEEEFSKNFNEYHQNFDFLLVNITAANYSSELDTKFK